MSNETVRLTYGELAQARRISVASARRMTVRRKWTKQIGNDGLTRVDVPADALTGASGDAGEDASTDASRTPEAPPIDEAMIAAIVKAVTAVTDASTDVLLTSATGDTRRSIVVLEEAVTSLRSQLLTERQRADHAEGEVRRLREEMAQQTTDHRRVVEMLMERIPRPWWRRYRRR